MTARSRLLLCASVLCVAAFTAFPGASVAAPGCVDLAIRQWAVRLVPNEADARLQIKLVLVNWGTQPVRQAPRIEGTWQSPRGGAAEPLPPWDVGSTEGLRPEALSELHLEAPECWWLPFPRSEYVITVTLKSVEDARPANNTIRIALSERAVRGLVRGEMGVWGPEGTETWFQGQVVGMRHTQNSRWMPWQSTTLDADARPWGLRQLRSADLGAPVHCGFDWWMPDHPTWPRAEEVVLPPGVVLAFCHTEMILNPSLQLPYMAAQRASQQEIRGPDGRVVLRRLIGPDLGAPSGVGFGWYETTEEGYEGQWEHLVSDLDALPRGTVLVVRHNADPRHVGAVPDASCRGYTRQWQLPAGTWRQITPLDQDARTLVTTWPPWLEWPRLNEHGAWVHRNGGDSGADAGVGWQWFEKMEAARGCLRPRGSVGAGPTTAPTPPPSSELSGPLVVLLGTPERVAPGQEGRIEVTVKDPMSLETLSGVEVTLRCDGGTFVEGDAQRVDGVTDLAGAFAVDWRAEPPDAYAPGITEHMITVTARRGPQRGSNGQKVLVVVGSTGGRPEQPR